MTTAKDLPRDRKECAEAITRGLLLQAQAGAIKNRADVVETLQSIGLEIERETKTSISVKAPDGGKNIRLKGSIYERDFRLSQDLRVEIESAGRDYAEQRTERARAARERLAEMLERKSAENKKRYKRPQRENSSESITIWLAALSFILALLLVSYGVIWWQGKEIASRWGELNSLPTAKVANCGEQKKRCVQVDPKQGTYGDNYMILKGA